MKKTITLTIDVEQDCPPYLKTCRGIEKGLPLICSLLDKYDIPATFFVTGDMASKYPGQIQQIAQHHEIGCHGYSHARFDKLTYRESVGEIEISTEVLCRLTGQEHISSFRAPNLAFPEKYLGILKDYGYLIDSSLARYKIGHLYRIHKYRMHRAGKSELLRIPVSVTSSLLRMPSGIEIIRRLPSPLVLFFHPWEFVEMQGEPVRWDCKINTGKIALANLESLIVKLKKNNYSFRTISGYLPVS